MLLSSLISLCNRSKRTLELPLDKSNKMTCVSGLKTDQTRHMPGLIWLFAGRMCHFIGFVMRQLIFNIIHFAHKLHRKWKECINIWAEAWQNPTQWPVLSVFTVRFMGSFFLCGQRRLWSDWMDGQAELSLCWALWSFYWFCHAVAHISKRTMEPYHKKTSLWSCATR